MFHNTKISVEINSKHEVSLISIETLRQIHINNLIIAHLVEKKDNFQYNINL